MKITTRLVLMCFLLVFMTVGATYAVMTYQVTQALSSYLLADLGTSAKRAEIRLLAIIQHNLDRLSLLTDKSSYAELINEYLQNGDETVKENIRLRFDQVRASVPEFDQLAVLDASGKVLVSTDEFMDNRPSFLAYFAPLSKRPAIGIFPDFAGNASMFMTAPLIADGETRAYICIVASAQSLSLVLPNEQYLGANAEILLAYRPGRSEDTLITSLKNGREYGIKTYFYEKEEGAAPAVVTALRAKQSGLLTGADIDGSDSIAVAHYVKSLDWALVVKVNRSEAFLLVNTIRQQGILLIIGLSLIAVVIGLFLSKTITGPLVKLSAQCRDFMAGKTEAAFENGPTGGSDEITILQRTFNHMLRNVKDNMERMGSQQKVLIEMMQETETARKKAEFAEQQFRRLIEAAPAAMIMLNSNRRIILVNEEAQKLFGYGAEDLLGRRVDDLLPGESTYPELAEALFSPGSEMAGEKKLHEITGVRKDGREIPLEVALNPIQMQTGLFILAALVDLSERRKAEENRSFLAAIVSSSEDAIIGKTQGGVITSWNEGAEKLSGYSAAESLGRPFSILFSSLEDENKGWDALQKAGQGNLERFDAIWKTKAGRVVDVSLTLSAVKDATGRIIGISTIARNVTERKRYEQRLAERNRELEKANLELDSFAYIASHDLRAPLRAISSFASFLEEDYSGKLDDQGRDFLNEIRKGADRLSRLIEDLLTLSRISRIKNPYENVNMNGLLKSVVERLRYDIEANDVDLVFQHDLPPVYCDRIKMTEVFVNLVNNAIKFSSKDNLERPAVEVGYSDKGPEHLFYVRDNGIGLDPRYEKQIFQLFKRLHSGEKYEGSGAGLSIVKRIVDDHGGRIWVESGPGKGATFYLTIPKDLKSVPENDEAGKTADRGNDFIPG